MTYDDQTNDEYTNQEYDSGSDSDHEEDSREQNSRFASNIQGRNVVNAITGKPYDFKKGSKLEKTLFKVMDSTGWYNTSGERIRVRRNRDKSVQDTSPITPNTYYYDSPMQYRKHKRIHNWKLSNKELKCWRNIDDKWKQHLLHNNSNKQSTPDQQERKTVTIK